MTPSITHWSDPPTQILSTTCGTSTTTDGIATCARGMELANPKVMQVFADHCDEMDTAMLARFHAGDPQVMAALYQQHAPRAVALVRRWLPRIDAEAVVQDAFVTLLGSSEQRNRFKGGCFAAYLCTMVRYRGIDAWRREQRYADVEVLPDRADPVSAADERVAAHELLKKFLQRSVPPKQKAYFLARFVDQRTQVESAALLGMKRSTLATWEKGLAERLRRAVVSGEIACVAQSCDACSGKVALRALRRVGRFSEALPETLPET